MTLYALATVIGVTVARALFLNEKVNEGVKHVDCEKVYTLPL